MLIDQTLIMKIQYDKTEKLLEIKDGLKTQYFVLNLVMIMNAFNAVVNLYLIKDRPLGWFGYLWIILGVVSIGVLIYQLLKKAAHSKIPLEDIRSLKEKEMLFGRKRLSLELKNGKSRDLIAVKEPSEMAEVKKLCRHIGIGVR